MYLKCTIRGDMVEAVYNNINSEIIKKIAYLENRKVQKFRVPLYL